GRAQIMIDRAEGGAVMRQLQAWWIEFTAAGHPTLNARSGKHDDLVLAPAIALWRDYGGGIASWGFLEATRWRTMASMPSEPRYFVGVDLGQSRDPTAIPVVRRVDPPRPAPKPTYAPGSLEWEQEQRRQQNEAAPG